MFVLLIISILVTITYCGLVMFSVVGFNRLKTEHVDIDTSEKNISIVIAARNEELTIERCVNSLLNQNYSKSNYEIIVVNDHSNDNTLEILNTIKTDTIKVLSLSEGKTSKKQALKLGIENASFELIAATDADCELPKEWLKTISTKLDQGTSMLLGPVAFKQEKGVLNAFQQLDMLAMQAFEFGLLAFNRPTINNGANLSFVKKAFINVEGYDSYKTPSGDDVFLLEKFKSDNLKIKGVLQNNFIVETSPTKTLNEFLNQRLRWASKSKFYTDNFLQFTSIIVLLQNLILLFIYSQVLFIEKFTLIYAILLLTKWLIDFILLFLVAAFFKRNKALLYPLIPSLAIKEGLVVTPSKIPKS